MTTIDSCLILSLMTISISGYAIGSQDTAKHYYTQQPQPIIAATHKLTWTIFPDFPGAHYVIIRGDPQQKGQYVVRLKLPSRYQIFPNWQISTVNLTVISGSILIGIGDKFDIDKGKTFKAGSSVIIPSKSHLFYWTTEEAVLQIQGLGPWGVQFVEPSLTTGIIP